MLRGRLNQFVDSCGPAGPVAVSRIVLGLAALLRAFVGAPLLLSLRDPDALRVPRAAWFAANSTLVWVLLFMWILSAAMFMVGWRYRWAGAALTATIGAVLAMDHQTFSNHLYLLFLAVLLMTLVDASARWSIDARRLRGAGTVRLWPVRLLQAQVSILFLWSVVGKLRSDFLSGSQLAAQVGRGLVSISDSVGTPRVMVSLSAATLLLEGFLALALWSPRLRPVALTAAAAFHVAILLLMEPADQLFVFALVMASAYLLFLVPTSAPDVRASDRVASPK